MFFWFWGTADFLWRIRKLTIKTQATLREINDISRNMKQLLLDFHVHFLCLRQEKKRMSWIYVRSLGFSTI